MKKLILFLITLGSIFTSSGQNVAELKLSPNVVNTDINGGPITKDDTIQVALILKNNLNS